MRICDDSHCFDEAVMGIRTASPESADGLVITIWQFVEDAPKKATVYCGPHGVRLAAGLAALSDATLNPRVTL